MRARARVCDAKIVFYFSMSKQPTKPFLPTWQRFYLSNFFDSFCTTTEHNNFSPVLECDTLLGCLHISVNARNSTAASQKQASAIDFVSAFHTRIYKASNNGSCSFNNVPLPEHKRASQTAKKTCSRKHNPLGKTKQKLELLAFNYAMINIV